MKRKILLLIILLIGYNYILNGEERNGKFNLGLSFGYMPTLTNCLGLARFDCLSVGVPLKLAFKNNFYIALRPEFVLGTKQKKEGFIYTVQYNLPSISLPLILGYNIIPALDLYAGLKLRYGGLSYTPTNGELVLKYDYTSSEWQTVCTGVSAGLNLKVIDRNYIGVEFSNFLIDKKYSYYLKSIAIYYTYCF